MTLYGSWGRTQAAARHQESCAQLNLDLCLQKEQEGEDSCGVHAVCPCRSPAADGQLLGATIGKAIGNRFAFNVAD